MNVLTLYLIRQHFKENYTIGKLYASGSFLEGKKGRIIEVGYVCDILEDKFRGNDLSKNKVAGKTCIPEGVYEVKMTFSPRFNRLLPQLMNVPYFEGIRIHSGNYAGYEQFYKTQKIDKTKDLLDVEEYIEVIDD